MEDFSSIGFNSYEEASLRECNDHDSFDYVDKDSPKNGIQSIKILLENNIPVLKTFVKLISLVLAPYLIAPLLVLLHWYDYEHILFSVVLGCSVLLFVYYNNKSHSPITANKSYNSLGASIPVGLHYYPSKKVKQILAHCPQLTSKEVLQSGLKGIVSTPWMFCGDFRTILPFCFFTTPILPYERRWIRVPLADGSYDNMCHVDEEGEFEAVALDCIKGNYSNNHGQRNKISYLILAGLTGGSQESYVVDLVQHAVSQGSDCYVMIARGLGGTPNQSKARFHGARITDIQCAAKEIRMYLDSLDYIEYNQKTRTSSVTADTDNDKNNNSSKCDTVERSSLFAVGISLGGIIVINSIARDTLPEVDGAVAIAGCFDTAKNMKFQHSRDFWQPILTMGLKGKFTDSFMAKHTVKTRLGNDYEEVVSRVRDIIDFDSVVVTALNGFTDVYHYYSDMSGASEARLNSLLKMNKEKSKNNSNNNRNQSDVEEEEVVSDTATSTENTVSFSRPLLAIHAADDPIIHVDTLPSVHHLTAVQGLTSLVTPTGGHVGWPLGWNPVEHRWKFQNTLTVEYCTAIHKTKHHEEISSD